ncbi:MAG: VanZ family protein [Lachnospiraceae bacterium]|nr:VanZ family protein [Lachnospiraceae bacterium]
MCLCFRERSNVKYTVTGWQRFWSSLLFVLYLAALVYLLFFSEAYGRTINREEYHYNLVLFREIRRFYQYRELLGFRVVMINLLGNVVAFMPFGFFLPILKKWAKGFGSVLLATLSFSLLIELLQLIYKVGTFDVDDLFLNTLGGVLGYLLLWGIRKRRG